MLGYKLKLTIIIGLFGLFLTFTVSFVDQWRFTNQITKDYEIQTSLIKDNVVTAVSDVDKAHQVLEKRLEERMKHYAEELLDKYEREPNIENWNYEKLKQGMEGMDIYIIDAKNVITHSSYTDDIDLNFAEIAPGFSDNLDHIRNNGKFVVDGMDAETQTGRVRKYSYMPTPDHKYIIELGFVLTDTQTFELFNFVNVIEQLKEKYSKVDDVIVYSADGKSLGSVDDQGEPIEFPKKYKAVLNKLKDDKSIIQEVDDVGVIHEFIPYVIKYKGKTKHYTDLRIIEITYNPKHLHEVLKENKQIFMIQLLVILGVALLISILITKLISKPMYLASYDLLTGLFTRAAFYTQLEFKLKQRKKSNHLLAVLLLDLDNFKLINDTLGHDGGDYFLKEIAKRIETSLRGSKDIAARLGGDEFGVILDPVQSLKDAEETAKRILIECKHPIMIKGQDVLESLNVSASIGIVMVPEFGEDSQTIYANADSAMYRAKNAGKNTYKVFDLQDGEKNE